MNDIEHFPSVNPTIEKFYLVMLLLASKIPASTVALIQLKKQNMFIKCLAKALRLLIIGFELSVILIHILISLTLLLRAGHIEINPGPLLTYTESIRITLKRVGNEK